MDDLVLVAVDLDCDMPVLRASDGLPITAVRASTEFPRPDVAFLLAAATLSEGLLLMV